MAVKAKVAVAAQSLLVMVAMLMVEVIAVAV